MAAPKPDPPRDERQRRDARPPTRIRRIRPFTTRFVNPITRLFVAWLPWFAIISYRGRRSRTQYRTPMNAFRHGSDWIFALTYGADVQWVRNVLAAGEADLEQRGRITHLVDPVVFTDPTRRFMPWPVRIFLRLIRVNEFLRMHQAT